MDFFSIPQLQTLAKRRREKRADDDDGDISTGNFEKTPCVSDPWTKARRHQGGQRSSAVRER